MDAEQYRFPGDCRPDASGNPLYFLRIAQQRTQENGNWLRLWLFQHTQREEKGAEEPKEAKEVEEVEEGRTTAVRLE